MPTKYHHSYDQLAKIMTGADLGAHVLGIVERAAAIARATAPELTGEFKNSFVVGTAVEDHSGRRVIGFLTSTDPDASAKEFANPDPDQNRTMNKAVRQALG